MCNWCLVVRVQAGEIRDRLDIFFFLYTLKSKIDGESLAHFMQGTLFYGYFVDVVPRDQWPQRPSNFILSRIREAQVTIFLLIIVLEFEVGKYLVLRRDSSISPSS